MILEVRYMARGIKITSNIDEYNRLLETANKLAKELKETIEKINNFKLEIGTIETKTLDS